MPFVKRDAEGRIAAVFHEASEPGLQQVAADDPALGEFLKSANVSPAQRQQWQESDLALARVLEDLIDLLIEKNVVRFTDFPEAAQQKLLARRGLRKEFAYMESLFAAEDDFGESGTGGGFL